MASLRPLSYFRCKIPGLDNDTYVVQDSLHENLINLTIPRTSAGLYDRCHIFETGEIGYGEPLVSANRTRAVKPCTEWVYDETVFRSTLTAKVIQRTGV